MYNIIIVIYTVNIKYRFMENVFGMRNRFRHGVISSFSWVTASRTMSAICLQRVRGASGWFDGSSQLRRSPSFPRSVRRQHLVKELVGHAALDEFILRQDAIFVFVHLAEDFFCSLFRSVVWVIVGQLRPNHVVDGLKHTNNTRCVVGRAP